MRYQPLRSDFLDRFGLSTARISDFERSRTIPLAVDKRSDAISSEPGANQLLFRQDQQDRPDE
jgi:hypothetical protein